MTDPKRMLERIVTESHRIQQRFFDEHFERILEAAQRIAANMRAGGKLLLFGNGGSAADAQHIAADFVGRFVPDRPALPALSLSTDTSVLTAVANDFGYDQIFARQIEALGQPPDTVVAISTSGISPNVLAGIGAARKKGLYVLGFTGEGGGKMSVGVDALFSVPSDFTPRIQETHIVLGHVLAELVDRELFPAAYDD